MSLDKLVKQLPELSGDAYPLDQWDPQLCGDMPLRIDSHGSWLYQDSEIKRERMITLFSKVLRKEADGGYYLVTPDEKLAITVDDAPFVVVDFDVGTSEDKDGHEWQTLWLITNIGDRLPLSADYPLEMREVEGEERPYLKLWRGLDALLSRNVYYQLISLAMEQPQDDKTLLSLTSQGKSYSLGHV